MILDIIGDIDEWQELRVAQALENFNDEELTIRINSYGGYVDSAQNICETIIEKAGESKITTLNTGDCMSAATLIYLLGEERKWDASKGDFLIHNPWCYNCGDAQAMYECADSLRDLEDYFAEVYAMTTEADKQAIKDIMATDKPMKADDMLAMNFCTELINKSNE